MARNGSGTYSLPSGNPVVTGTTISSSTHNTTMTDIADEITNSTDKDGQTVITGTWDFNGNKIILDADADTSITADTDDQIDVEIGGSDIFSFTTTSFLWTTPTFSAGDYTGNNSMTWTVASGDVSAMAYTIIGKVMTVAFRILSTTVGGTPSTQLQIAIPASKTATKEMLNPCFVNNNGTAAIGFCRVEASGTVIIIQLVNSGNWASSTDNTNVIGQITFEIN